MRRAKPIDSPRPSIFDDLNEKYPELATKGPVKPPRRKVPGFLAGLALVAVLGAGVVGLYVWVGDAPSAPDALPGAAVAAEGGAELPPPVPPPAPAATVAELPVDVPAVKRPAGVAPTTRVSEPRPPPQAPDRPPAVAVASPLPSSSEKAPALLAQETPAPCDAASLRQPVKLYGPGPEYPESARQALQEGTVIVEAEIGPGGAVERVRTLRSATPELDRAALEVVKTWRFEPATCAGQAVFGYYRTALHFDLTPPTPPAAGPAEAVLEEGAPEAETDGDLEPPVRLFAPQPTYPPAAWVAAIEGDVTLRATIDEDGLVAAVEVLNGVSPGLDAAAVAALERWRFRPARRGGEAVRFEQVLTFRFRR